ncbi:cupredoxin domain-containing protein [Paludibacterium paludis]|uniref:EfeO-type cupredoxin-like domain-containing protein n=1 Tax=Paludibacterium paludis TaxID=1225769 RepID=A0A918P3F0_9NEIS|nr:cupredoxin domain-containing protein [Paludibacterium paludis]GGY16722.1 hypothetical protein GCM10011289_20110 [Paludibacterium paludis]
MKTLRLITLLALLPALAPAEDMPTFKLELKDGVLNPSRLVVPADKPFRLEVKNTGKTPAEFESLQLRKEKVLAPGAESVVVFRKISPGEYKFYDEFHMKTAQGVIIAK